MKRHWYLLRLGSGLLILAGLIVYFSPSALLREIGNAQVFWLMLSAGMILVSTLIGSYSLYLLITRNRPLPYSSFLGPFWASWAFGLVVPGQVGDMATISLLLRKKGLSWQETLGRSIVDKLISLVVLCIFAAVGLWQISEVHLSLLASGPEDWLVALGAGLALVLLARIAGPYLARRHQTAWQSVLTVWREVRVTAVRHPYRATANALLTVVKVSCIGLAYWCTFRSLGQTGVDVLRTVPLVAASALVAYIPVSLNGLGTVEMTGILLFGTLGIPDSTVLSAYLLLRMTVLTLAWLPAGLLLFVLPAKRANQHVGQREGHTD